MTEPLHFVISAPRSGSTWLASALNHHPQIFATEQRLFGHFCEVWKNNDGSSSPRMTFDSYTDALAVHYFYANLGLDRATFKDQFLQEYAQFLVQFALRRTDKQIVVDKITPYAGTAKRVVAQIRKLFPQSRIIQLVRDGRDVVTSGTFDWLLKDAVGTPRYDFFVNHVANQQGSQNLARFFDDSVIERWSQHWRETIDVFQKQTPEEDNWIQIRYEAMQTDMAGQLSRIFEFLGLANDRAIAQHCADQASFEKMTGRPAGSHQPTQKARMGIVGDWKNYFTQTDGQQFDSLAGAALIELGYEPDHHWVSALPPTLNLRHATG